MEPLVSDEAWEALDELDVEPLPDEPLSWDALPEDIHERVAEVVALCDAFSEEHMDVEFRTAVRRLLGDAAGGDPRIFRRAGAAKTAAAAVCWIVAKANNRVSRWDTMTAKELLAAFGVTGSVSTRAEVFQRAIGVNPYEQYGSVDLGTTRYLIAERRLAIVELRDRYRN